MSPRVLTRRRAPVVDPAGASAEPFRTLRLALQLNASETTGSTILFTSPGPNDGKSTLAANYALISALSGDRVLLVDGDLRRPSLHEFLGVERSPGLVEMLATGGTIKQFAQPIPGIVEIDLLAAGRPISRTGDLTASQRMADLLGQATAEYDLVVIDSPPVLDAADAAGLASHPGVAVVVVVRPTTKRRLITRALRDLELVEANVAGIVLNRYGRLEKYSRY
jgi:capsular exopolysaccharide synthesis family protein